jgi:acyl carrier protein
MPLPLSGLCRSTKRLEFEMSQVIDSTEARVKKIVSEQFGMSIADVRGDAKICADIGADSLDALELVMSIEDEFDLYISDDDTRLFPTMTVDQAVEYVRGRLTEPKNSGA